MRMPPRLRRLLLTVHVVASVGWLGAVLSFLALAVIGLNGSDEEQVRAAYISMKMLTWAVIVPLSLASPLSGIVQGLGTRWGLFRHYWVLIKLLITIPATLLLLVHLQPIGHMAEAVQEIALAHGQMRAMRLQLVADAAAAIFVLVIATVLSIYKPPGLTRYGRRKERQESAAP